MAFVIEFPGPYYNRDRNATPYVPTFTIARASRYETREDAEIALERVKRAKMLRLQARRAAQIREI